MFVNRIRTLLVIWILVIKIKVWAHNAPTFDRRNLPLYGPQPINSPRSTGLLRKLCWIYNICPFNNGINELENVSNYKNSKDIVGARPQRLDHTNPYSQDHYKQYTRRSGFGLEANTYPYQALSEFPVDKQAQILPRKKEKPVNQRPIGTLLFLLDNLLNYFNLNINTKQYQENFKKDSQINRDINDENSRFHRPLNKPRKSKATSYKKAINDIDPTQNSRETTAVMQMFNRSTRATGTFITQIPTVDNMTSSTNIFTEVPISSTASENRAANITLENVDGSVAVNYSLIEPKIDKTMITDALRKSEPNDSIQNIATTEIGETRTMTRSGIPTENYMTTALIDSGYIERVPLLQQKFAQALDQFERNFYTATFTKLSSISPPDRRENGISFVESGLFLYLILTALSLDMDKEARAEIDKTLALAAPEKEKLAIIDRILKKLPTSNDNLKFRWSSRLVVNGSQTLKPSIVDAARLRINRINATKPEQLMNMLNHMVEEDSGGAMRNTFEEDEVAEGARAVLLSTLYVRARWRASPTLLNGTHAFRDADGAPARSATMIRINDIMRYADLTEWDAQAVEISYATPGLNLLLLVPRGRSLRALSERVTAAGLQNIIKNMKYMRIAATLPIYTLRMTLLLPNKLQAIGISQLVDTSDAKDSRNLRLSHAVQRLMFWAEAGRNAFKDDGIEWDAPPQLELVVDRPYLFFVRWHNLTLMNGNFVL